MKITVNSLQSMKQRAEKISALTVYDASFACVLNQCDIDILLVGDSLGNVIQGHDSTIPVTVEAVCYHTRCVARGNSRKFIISDMPFMSYATPKQALRNAARLMQAGAQMVKLEGGAWLADTVSSLTERGIPVCGHLGLTPQSVHKLGGYKMQGKDARAAEKILEDALLLEKAGAQLMVLELIPPVLAEEITRNLSIPTIGIGAGSRCDGQVLVLYDMLGISTGTLPAFAKNFLQGQDSIQAAVQAYASAVRSAEFPGD